MRGVDVRASFLDFFSKSHDHHVAPSIPLLPKNDPSLMFVNAGMNAWKRYLVGHPRAGQAIPNQFSLPPLFTKSHWFAQINDPSCGRQSFSFDPPSNSLVSVSDPSKDFLPRHYRPQRALNFALCVAVGTSEIKAHNQVLNARGGGEVQVSVKNNFCKPQLCALFKPLLHCEKPTK